MGASFNGGFLADERPTTDYRLVILNILVTILALRRAVSVILSFDAPD